MEPNLRILLVSEYFPPDVKGGGEVSAELLAKNLLAAGHEVHVLTTQASKAYNLPGAVLHRTLRTASHLTLPGNIRRMLRFPAEVRREVRRLDKEYHFTIIHYLNVVSILGSLKRKGQVATINSPVPFCPKGNLFYKEREPCSGCAALKFIGCLACSHYVGLAYVPWWVRLNPLFLGLIYFNYLRFQGALWRVHPIAVSTYIADELAARGFADAPTIPHLLPFKTRKARAGTHQTVRILYLGSIAKYKGVMMLLEAYALIPPERRGKLLLQMAGDGPLRETLEGSAEVRFLGLVSQREAAKLMAACDIVVLPSVLAEPLSRVLLEAISYGKPIIATNVGGNPDVVLHGVNGILVPQDKAALAAAIEKLANDPDLRRRLGRAGLKLYEKRFSSKSIVAKLESFYDLIHNHTL